jgi:hypothetical protein
VLVVSASAGDAASSALVTDLAAPNRLDHDTWVRPGRVSWSWWSDTSSPRDLAQLRNHIDLAAEFGWEYSLVDVNWTVRTDEGIKDLVGYAAERGVRVWLWYNSGGPNTHVPEQPRDRMVHRDVRRAELAKLAGWGVAGVKVDFFHSDKQESIARYLAILEGCRRAPDHGHTSRRTRTSSRSPWCSSPGCCTSPTLRPPIVRCGPRSPRSCGASRWRGT